MHVVWFKKDGEWHWIEIYLESTVGIVKSALKLQGYVVTDSGIDPRKCSVINNLEN